MIRVLTVVVILLGLLALVALELGEWIASNLRQIGA